MMRIRDIIAPTLMLGIAGGYIWANLPTAALHSPEENARIEASMTYGGCDEVRMLGKAPLHAGEPGYRSDMDGDGDGIACEPIR